MSFIDTRMTSPYQRNKVPHRKLKSDHELPQWQLVIGGIFIAVGGMLAGIKIAELAFSIWMPGALR
jgi:hypothetical protein